MKKEPCEQCTAKYFTKITGEDGRGYIVPVEVVFCPFCGRRLKDAQH